MALPKMLKKFLVLCSGAIPAGITAHTIWRNKIADVQEKVILDDIPKIEEEEIVPEKPEEEQNEKQEEEQKKGEKSEESSGSAGSEGGDEKPLAPPEEDKNSKESSEDSKPEIEEEGDEEDEQADDDSDEDEREEDDNEEEDPGKPSDSESDGIEEGTKGGLEPDEAILEMIKKIISEGSDWAKEPGSLLSTYQINYTVTQMTQLLKKIQKAQNTAKATEKVSQGESK